MMPVRRFSNNTFSKSLLGEKQLFFEVGFESVTFIQTSWSALLSEANLENTSLFDEVFLCLIGHLFKNPDWLPGEGNESLVDQLLQ